MYNLNVNVNVNLNATAANPPMAANLLSVAAAAEVTPRTPEIVNSLIAMTNPFDGYATTNNNNSSSSSNNNLNGGNGYSDRSRLRNDSTSSGEPSPPSIQHTCSQLIKEGLKLTLQTKRRANGAVDDAKKKTRKEDNSADDEEDDESSYTRLPNGLTPEDEERRRRRRERNKIAATKCRLKKREKTVILVQESETLETQNHVLKSQIQELETQRRRLVDMLNLHGPTCIKHPAPGDATYQQQQYPDQQQQQQPLPNYQENFMPGGATTIPVVTTTHHQTADCNTIVPDYGPVKVENFDAVQVTQDFFASQQDSVHYSTNNTTTTTTSNVIVGSSDAAGCPV